MRDLGRDIEELVQELARALEEAAGRRPPPGPTTGADSTVGWLLTRRRRALRWLRHARRWRVNRYRRVRR